MGERGGFGEDGDEHARADARTAGAPEAARAARHSLSALLHLHQSLLQLDVAACVSVGREQRGADQHVMLRPVEMAKRLRHQQVDDLDGIFGAGAQTHGHHRVHSGSVALVAHEMALHATCSACHLLVAQRAFHYFIFLQVLQRGTADKAFIVYHLDMNF